MYFIAIGIFVGEYEVLVIYYQKYASNGSCSLLDRCKDYKE